jgi:cell division transport system permease protein
MAHKDRVNKRQHVAREPVNSRLRYFVERALRNMRQNMFISMITVITIALALLIVGIFLLVAVNLERVSVRWSERVQITVYFDKELVQQQAADLRNRITAIPGTMNVTYVSQAEALSRFKTRLTGQETLLEGIGADVLPASMEITLKKSFRNHAAMKQYVGQLRNVAGVGEIQYGEEWVKRYSSFVSMLQTIGMLIASFLFIAVVFIIANTIRLTIYARKDELEVLSLVGATRFFIKAPFIIEGVIQGACGSVISLLILAGGYLIRYQSGESAAVQSVLKGMEFLPTEYLAALFLSGIMLGFFGSITSLRRFMKF